MKKLIAIALVLGSQFALAATDYKCMSDCAKAGYQYSYCKRICSY